MRKRVIVTLAAAMALLLCACGGKEKASSPAATQPVTEPPVTETTAPEVEKTPVTAIVAQNSQQTAQWWASFEESYEAANPTVDLQLTFAAWQDVDPIVRERIAAGNIPDLVHTDRVLDYSREGLLLSTDVWVSQQTYDKFYPQLLSRAAAQDKVWGIPDYAEARALYYNADILEAAGVEVPATWNELTEACKQIRAYDYGLYPWGVDMTMDEGYATFAYYVWNNGSDFTDDAGNWSLDDPRNLSAVEYITGMVNTRLTNPDPTAESRYQCQELFGQGKIAMMIAPSSLPAYCEALGSMVNYGIAPLPSNGGNPSVSTATGNFLVCLQDADRTAEELAILTSLVDAIYEDSTYTQWVQTEGGLPATRTGNSLLQNQDPQMAVWDQILNSLKFYPSQKEAWNSVKEGAVSVLQRTLWEGNTWLLLDNLQKEAYG